MIEWYYTLNGEQQGPVPQEQLQAMLQSGQLDINSTKVWRMGFAEWQDAHTVAELNAAPELTPTAEASNGTDPTTTQNPYAAPAAVESIQVTNTSVLEIPSYPTQPDIGEVISISWSHLRKSMGVLVLGTLIFLLVGIATEIFFSLIQQGIDGSTQNFDDAEFWIERQNSQVGFGMIVKFVLSTLVNTFFALGYGWMILNVLRGRGAEVGDLFSQSHNVIKTVLAGLIYGICVFSMSLLLVIPGIWIAIRLGYYQAAILEKDLGPIEALRYSFALTRGSALSLLAIFIIGFIFLIVGLLLCLVGGLWSIPLFSLMASASFLYMHGGLHFIVDPERVR